MCRKRGICAPFSLFCYIGLLLKWEGRVSSHLLRSWLLCSLTPFILTMLAFYICKLYDFLTFFILSAFLLPFLFLPFIPMSLFPLTIVYPMRWHVRPLSSISSQWVHIGNGIVIYVCSSASLLLRFLTDERTWYVTDFFRWQPHDSFLPQFTSWGVPLFSLLCFSSVLSLLFFSLSIGRNYVMLPIR